MAGLNSVALLGRHLAPKPRWGLSAAVSAASRRAVSTTSWQVKLNYQVPLLPGKRTGRYVDQPDKGDAIDEHVPTEGMTHNARLLTPAASLETTGFALEKWPTKCRDFCDDDEVVRTYYPEMRELIKGASGAHRVLILDHTTRNTQAGGSAAPVPRALRDYAAGGAPGRLMQFATAGVWPRRRSRALTERDITALACGRFAFVNVWRNIADEPAERSPLVCCDPGSVPKPDCLLYDPSRAGESYSPCFHDPHKRYYYPRMAKDEALVFKVYDKEERPRFVFHTAFEDPLAKPDSPAHQSIEIRAVAFFSDGTSSLEAESGSPESNQCSFCRH